MSTFGGKIQEFPGISVDRFDGANEQSKVYFLSHCHTDHMVGLGSAQFQKKLIKSGKYLFGSSITCIILGKMYPDIKNNLKELSLYSSTNVMLGKGAFCVTAIPAGHCPGSVMFLFEGNTKILYTGDFRIHKGDIRKFKSFYDSFNNVKSIEKIYLDTTFFYKEFFKFPKREDSLNELCMIIKEWLDMGSLFMINLITSAKYGYEYLFIEIYRKLGMPIHVNQEIYDFYCLIPEMDKSITTDGSITRIHSSCGVNYQSTCSYKSHGVVKPVKVSAFRWNQETLSKGISIVDPYMHYVCYSTHASYEEAIELIQFLKPKSVEACVKPSDPQAYSTLNKSIEEVLEGFGRDGTVEAELNENVPKLFKIQESIVEEKTAINSLEKEQQHTDWKILEKDDLTSIMNLQPNDPYGSMLDSPPREDIKPSTDVLTTIMDLSSARPTLKGAIKRGEHTFKRERSFTVLDSLTESSSSSQLVESSCMIDNSQSMGNSDVFDELKPRCSKKILPTTSKSTAEISNCSKDVNDSYKSSEILDQSSSDVFEVIRVRNELLADDDRSSMTIKNTSHSTSLCDIEIQSEPLVTERNFLLEIIESEPSLAGQMETRPNESETEADFSALYDLLGLSPPQK